MNQENDEFILPEDLQDVEIIYSDNEDDEEGNYENEENPYEEVEDKSKFSFTNHEKSVFAVDISPDGKHVVTGGEDDMAFVWDIDTKEILITCNGHKDSVSQVGFNHDGKYVATADMSGMIQVWNVSEKNLAWSNEMGDLEWLQWHPIANVLIAGFHTGEIYIWQVPSGNCKALPSHGQVSSCGKILPDGKRLVAGYGDGQVKLWDLKTTSLLWKKTCSSGITALAINSNGTLLGIAPTSELALISDGRHVVTLKCDDKDDIECIEVSSELGVIITGSISGEVCIWNLAKHVLRHKISVGCAVTVLKLGRNGELFFGAGGAIYECNAVNGTITKGLTGHVDDILDIAVPRVGNYIVSSSDDSTVKIFDI
ncbi:angio-associated migratory cell protein [Coccinella septempunctata]|uniref:angio-associated migratory cell protein n=1 Tax=Coccinella septempunctata TaxID=41139 RepID=UPI001D088C7A|nr:angio-associated migratory cell protein [Coccinella septempunctata]